jgi:hypothetical protein
MSAEYEVEQRVTEEKANAENTSNVTVLLKAGIP